MAEDEDLYVGIRALQLGLVQKDQVIEVLYELAQERRSRDGQIKPRSLGMFLIQRGYFRQADLDRILAERAPREKGKQRNTDRRLSRLVVAGRYAWVTQVEECLQVQAAEMAAGKPARPLGDIMSEKGYVTSQVVRRLLADHEKTLYTCNRCAMRVNILRADPRVEYRCKKCGGVLAVSGLTDTSVAYSKEDLPTIVPDAPSACAPNQEELDRALSLYLRQKNMARKDALDEAEAFQDEVGRYGIQVPLLEVVLKRKLLSWQHSEQVKKLNLDKIVKSEAWSKQAVPGYTVVRKIASGGTATIFAANPLFGGPMVALKALNAAAMKDPVAVERFRKEGVLLMRLGHPHLVKAFDAGKHRHVRYIVMEHVDGIALDQAVRATGPARPDAALEQVRQVASALQYLQQEGYIHRDVKPENVLLDQAGNVKLCDLGFAAEIRTRPAGGQAPSPGTPGYVSPEQARGELDLKVGTDIYSLGLTLYFTLTGVPPFEGATSDAIMADRFSQGVARPDFKRLPGSPKLGEFLRRMLHEDRAKRFTTYPELLSALAAVR